MTLPLSIVFFIVTTEVPLATLSVLAASAMVLALPAGIVIGALIDRRTARMAMIVNAIITAAGYACYAFADDVVTVAIALFLVSVGDRTYWPSWTTYIHDLSGGHQYDRWFAFLEAMKMASMGVGAAAASIVLLFAAGSGFRILVLLNVALTLLAGVIIALHPVRPSAAIVAHHRKSPRKTALGAWAQVMRSRDLRRITAGQFFLSVLVSLPGAALSVSFVSVWNMPAMVSPVMFTINTTVTAIFLVRVNKALTNWSVASRVWVASIVVVGCILPLGFIPNPAPLASWAYAISLSIVLAGANMILVPPIFSLMATIPSAEIRGRANGVFQTASAVGIALFPLLIGFMNPSTLWVAWTVSSAAVLLGAAFYASVNQTEREEDARP